MLIVTPYHHLRLLWFAGTVSTITPVYSRYFARAMIQHHKLRKTQLGLCSYVVLLL